jgi:hypothetical protein
MRKFTSLGVLGVLIAGAATLAVPSGASGAPSVSHSKFLPSGIQAPWALGEHDEGLDNAKDAYGLCRTAAVAGIPFEYSPVAGQEVDAILNDPINLSGASNFGCTTPQNETSIAVNPTNPLNVVAGANDYRVCCDADGLNDGTGWAYASFDGGLNWQNVQLPGLTVETGGMGNFHKVDSAGDPALAFGPDGTVYYANIVFSRDTPSSGIAVSSSSDGGRTWSAPNMVAYNGTANFFNDKEWIAAGPNGKVVVTWTRFSQGAHGAGYLASTIVGAISADKGKTWNRQGFPVSDAAHPYDQGSQVAFAPNGDLIVSYEGASPTAGYTTDAMVIARSTDDGRSFATREIGHVYDDLDCYPVAFDRQVLSNQHFRINSYPSMAIDPTSGRIAVTWADDQFGPGCGSGGTAFPAGVATSNQVKLVVGTWPTFSAPQGITTDSVDKVFPSVATYGGRIVVSYYTAEAASSNPACHVKIPDDKPDPGLFAEPSTASVCLDYAARTSDSAYAVQQVLTSEGSNPYVQFANGAFIGDYTQIAMGSDGIAHAAWTDFRGRPGVTGPNQDVYVASVRPPAAH